MSMSSSNSIPNDAGSDAANQGLSTFGGKISSPNGLTQQGPRWEDSPQYGGRARHPGFDIWGPLQRRKFLIGLFCLIGATLGFLHFLKTPKTYQSVLRLMITTQAPPIVANGNLKLEGASMPKHASLISSQLVLSQAVEAGEFATMESFRNTNYPVENLKTMLDISSDTENSETLKISCKGPYPNDLPIILNQIVAAYRNNIEDDSQAFGEESTKLIQEVSGQLSNDIQRAEKRSLELFTQLGITTVSENGLFLNPFSQKLVKLLAQQDDARSTQRRLNDRLELYRQSINSDDENQITVIAIEAKTYLKLTRAPMEIAQSGQLKSTVDYLPGKQSREQLESLKKKYSEFVVDLGFKLDELTQKYGRGHSKITNLRKRIDFYEKELDAVESDLLAYNDAMEEKQESQEVAMKNKSAPLSAKAFRANEDRRWVKIYGLSLERELQQLNLTLNALGGEIEVVSKQAEDIAAGVTELNLLKKEISDKGDVVRASLDQLNEMKIMTKSFSRTKVRVLDKAVRAKVIAPSMVKSLALGTMLAFILGLGLAVVVDRSELSFRSPHEITECLNLPVVGRIPRIDVRKSKGKGKQRGLPTLMVVHSPGSSVAEAFRDVRTYLFYHANNDDVKTILFTSPSPGDGKSTTCCNLALSIAQAGKRVILVDADFRRPRVHQNFEEKLSPGLFGVLTGESSLENAILDSEVESNLSLLTAGGRPKNPGELVTSRQFAELIKSLRAEYDFVLIDSPPALAVSDPASIASLVDGVVLVTRIRKGVKVTTQRAKQILDRVGTRWVGVVVNGYDKNNHYSDYNCQYGDGSSGRRYGRYYERDFNKYLDRIAEKSTSENL